MGKPQKLSNEELSTLERSKREEVKRLQKLLNSAISKGNLSEESKLCNTLGEILAEAGLLQLALRYNMQDLEISEKHLKPMDIAVAHRKVGAVYAELGEFGAAVSHQENYMQISEKEQDIVEQQRAHATLGHTYYIQLMSDMGEDTGQLHKKSAIHYSTAMKLTSVVREKRLLSEREIRDMRARLFLNIGLLYLKATPTTPVSSTQYLERALADAKELRDFTLQHLALFNLAESNLSQGNLEQALSYAQQAVKTGKAGDNSNELAASCELLALVHLHSHDVAQARTSAKQALQMNTDLEAAMTVYKVTKLIMATQQADFGEGEAAVETLSKISDIFIKLSLYTHAISWLEKQLNLALTDDALAAAQGKLGACYREAGNVKLALYHFTQQIALLPSASAWTQIALLSMQDHQSYEDCWDAVQAGRAESRSVQDHVLCLKTLLEIAEHFEKDGTSAREELDNMEVNESESWTLEASEASSDVEISESESESVDGESEVRAVRGKRVTKGKVNEKGETPLHQAAVAGNAKKVRELLGKHASPNTRDHAGWTPLHEACNYGYTEIAGLLVQAGADINDRGGRECGGTTPLHDAAQWGNRNIVQLLIEHGAHILAKDDEGRTALQLVENILSNAESEETDGENSLAIKHCLVEAMKNPRKVQPTRRVDSSDLFTTGARDITTTPRDITMTQRFTTSTQLASSKSSDRRDTVLCRSQHQQNNSRTGRVSDSVIPTRKLPRPGTKKQRSSEPTKHTQARDTEPTKHTKARDTVTRDDWLIPDHESPKRKHEPDPFISNDKKRSKQTKLATHVTVQDDSKTPAQVVCSKIVRVKIRVRDTLFMIPVQPAQTMGDIAKIASQRYKSTVGLLPLLTLTTCDGALLNSEDVASLLLADGDELIGVIQESEQEALVDKYLATCQRLGVEATFKETFSNCTSNLSISRSLSSSRHLECFFTTILCSRVLTTLDISFNKLAKETFSTCISSMPTLKSLATLNVAGCGIGDASFPKISAALATLPLQHLTLDFNHFPASFAPLLELCVQLPLLATLSARNCSLATKAAVAPQLSVKFANSLLSSIDLSQNAIAHFPELPGSLTALHLGGLDGILEGSLSLPASLHTLTLEKCGIVDAHIHKLADLRNMLSLRVAHNHITREGIVDLLMHLPSLAFLDLSSNPLGCEGIEELCLVAPPSLTVKLQNCRAAHMSRDTVETIATSLASCDISYNKVNYPKLSKELSQEMRSAVTCHGSRLLIKAASVQGA